MVDVEFGVSTEVVGGGVVLADEFISVAAEAWLEEDEIICAAGDDVVSDMFLLARLPPTPPQTPAAMTTRITSAVRS